MGEVIRTHITPSVHESTSRWRGAALQHLQLFLFVSGANAHYVPRSARRRVHDLDRGHPTPTYVGIVCCAPRSAPRSPTLTHHQWRKAADGTGEARCAASAPPRCQEPLPVRDSRRRISNRSLTLIGLWIGADSLIFNAGQFVIAISAMSVGTGGPEIALATPTANAQPRVPRGRAFTPNGVSSPTSAKRTWASGCGRSQQPKPARPSSSADPDWTEHGMAGPRSRWKSCALGVSGMAIRSS
jgi:hypothetical protein